MADFELAILKDPHGWPSSLKESESLHELRFPRAIVHDHKEMISD